MTHGDGADTPAAQGPPRPTAFWHALTAVWAVLAASMSASIAPHFYLVILVLCFGGFLGLIWTFQVLRVLLDAGARGLMTRRAFAGWAAYPATGALLVLLFWSQWPFALRVRLSEPELVRLAEEAGGDEARIDRRVGAGLVFVETATVRDNCVLLCVGHGFLTDEGLAYSLDGNGPSARWPCTFRHLFGRWYTYSEGF